MPRPARKISEENSSEKRKAIVMPLLERRDLQQAPIVFSVEEQ